LQVIVAPRGALTWRLRVLIVLINRCDGLAAQVLAIVSDGSEPKEAI
jgi:hypothetical protein